MRFTVFACGSYQVGDRFERIWGAGAVVIDESGKATELSSCGSDKTGNPVIGEEQAVVEALRYIYRAAKQLHCTEKPVVEVYCEHEGVSQSYVKTVDKAKDYLTLLYVHTGCGGTSYGKIAYNLAKQALQNMRLAKQAPRNMRQEEDNKEMKEVRLILTMDKSTYSSWGCEEGIAAAISANMKGISAAAAE